MLLKFRFKPKLIVFDLDHTLWPFGVDTFFYVPPYAKNSGKVYDFENKEMKIFCQVDAVLKKLALDERIDLAAASRTEYPEGAYSLLSLFGLDNYFKYKEIYPGSKTVHFEQFQRLTKYSFNQMLFFDDEQRNIEDVSAMGVTAILVDPDQGITWEIINEGLKRFCEKRAQA